MNLAGVLMIVLAVAALVPLIVALAHRPQRGVLLLAALVPFDGLLLLIPHPALVDGWKQALVVLVLAATFVAPPAARGAGGRRLPDWLWPVAGLLAISVASALVVGGTQGLLGMKIGFFYLLLFWAIWRCPLGARDRDRLVSVLMSAGALTAVVGLAQQVAGPAALNALGYEYNTAIRFAGGLLRSFSTFNQPFPFGLFVMLVLLVAVPVALADPKRRRNAAFLAGTPVLVAGMLSSTVRSAILGLVVGLVFLAAHRYRGMVHLVAPALIGFAFIPIAVIVEVASSGSLGARTSGWTNMVGVAMSAPFGIGIGATGSAGERATEISGRTGDTLVVAGAQTAYQPDNHFVKTLLELGPVGLWLQVLLLIATFMAARHASRVETGADSALATGIGASILAAAAASCVQTYFEIFPLDVYSWLLLGALTSMDHESRRSVAAAFSVSEPQQKSSPTS